VNQLKANREHNGQHFGAFVTTWLIIVLSSGEILGDCTGNFESFIIFA
jgi:hypothetical protein